MDSASRLDSSPPSLALPLELSAVLGPDKDRYFASGYRSVRYEVNAIRAANDGESISADCAVRYPADWSRRTDGTVRVPHLSTIDAVILPLLVTERLSPSIRDSPTASRVAAFSLRAGAEPWDRLDRVPVTYSATPDPAAGTLRLDGTVGNIKSSVTLANWPADAHEPELTTTAARTRRENRSISRSVYGDLTLATRTSTWLTDYDPEARVLRCEHRAETEPAAAAAGSHGLESAYWPGVTAIDQLTLMGQLAQAIIYIANGIDRARMGTLWMRNSALEFSLDPLPLPGDWTSTTTIVRDRRIRGAESVHDLLVQSRTSSGVTAKASLAYSESAE